MEAMATRPQSPSYRQIECVWNVMAHAQKPDFVFRRNGRVHLNRRGRQFSRLLAVEVCASAVVMLGTLSSVVVWSGVKGIGYPLHSPVFPSFPLPCVTVCHHVSAGLYLDVIDWPQYWSEPLGSHVPPGRYLWVFLYISHPLLEDILHKPMCFLLVFFAACNEAPNV